MEKIKKIFKSYREACLLFVGEVIVSLLTVAVFLLLRKYDYTVLTGVALGSAAAVANLLILSVTVNRAIDKYLALRGTAEMDEESAAAFAAENARSVQLAASGTYLVRTLVMAAALVCAFAIGDIFNVWATVVPLVMYRPIIYACEIIRIKIENKHLQNSDNNAQIGDGAQQDAADAECSGGEADQPYGEEKEVE